MTLISEQNLVFAILHLTSKFFQQLRRCSLAQLFDKCLAFLHRLVNLGAMIEIVCQSRVHVSQRKIVFSGYFVGALAHALVPDNNVFHRYPMSGDTWFATYDARRNLNMLVQRFYCN